MSSQGQEPCLIFLPYSLQNSAHSPVMLSVIVVSFHTDYTKNSLYGFSYNSQTSFFILAPFPFWARSHLVLFGSFWSCGAKAYMIQNYSSLAHTQSVKSLHFITESELFELGADCTLRCRPTGSALQAGLIFGRKVNTDQLLVSFTHRRTKPRGDSEDLKACQAF